MTQEVKYDFALFFAIWAQIQKWTIPEVHLRIINFLEDGDWDNGTKVLLLWRSVGKSTLVDLWVAYMLSKDPTLRFMIISADFDSACKGTKDLRHILRNHPFCQHLVSKTLEDKQDRFFVVGSKDKRNPSVIAKSISGNVTGSRADYLIFDDVEVPKNSGSDRKRDDLKGAIAEASKLLDKKREGVGRRLFIGTYHDEVSIYDDQINSGASFLKVPIMEKPYGEFPYMQGEPNWPEMFGIDAILELQRTVCKAKAEFYSQYMLIPASIKDARLDPNLLQVYKDEVQFFHANNSCTAKIGETIIASVTAYWDVSLGKTDRDDSVLAIVFIALDGHIYIHRVFPIKSHDPVEQANHIKRYALQFNLPLITLETNGVGAFLPRILSNELQGTGIGVSEHFETKAKWKKIIEALETPLYGGFLHVHQSVAEGKFFGQLRDFDPENMNIKNDYVDSVASAILRQPVRIQAAAQLVNKSITRWGDGSQVVEMAPLEVEFTP